MLLLMEDILFFLVLLALRVYLILVFSFVTLCCEQIFFVCAHLGTTVSLYEECLIRHSKPVMDLIRSERSCRAAPSSKMLQKGALLKCRIVV